MSTIGYVLGNWSSAVAAWRAGEIPEPLHPPEVMQRRKCLAPGCDRWFDSWGAANRICSRHSHYGEEGYGTVYTLRTASRRGGLED